MFFKKKAKEAAPAEGETPESTGGEGGEGGGEGEGSKKKPPLKLLIIGGAAAVLVLGGGGAGAFFLLKPKPAGDAAHAEAGHEKPEKKKKKKEGGGHGKGGKDAGKTLGEIREGPDGVVFYTLPDLVVNIQSLDGRPAFLKLKLTFELSDEAVTERLEADAPRLQDALQSFLRELRPEDLSGSQGSYQLRMEILRRVNLIMAPEKVDAVLIEEMLIQ